MPLVTRRSLITAVLALVALASFHPSTARAQAAWARLSEREKTFVTMVFSGEEAKAVEFAKAAGINPNAIAGEPLSIWFYRLFIARVGPPYQREPNIQRIVFDTFRQNPNPPNVGETSLSFFCKYAPVQPNAGLRKPYVDGMAEGFDSLIKYGLKDKAIINDIFRACFFGNAASLADGDLNAYVYDTLITKILHAGADINTETVAGERPIQFAVKSGYPDIVERLIRDGAQVNFPLRHSGNDRGVDNGPCTPSLNKSLYAYGSNWVRSRNEPAVVRIVSALASRGVSALTKYGYLANDGSGRCIFKSFYDAVLDTGNVAFANAVKAAAETAKTTPPPAKTASAHPSPPSSSTAPGQIGAWTITVGNDNRPVAVAKAEKHEGDQLAGLRLECVAGGRLEYVPVALKLGAIQSLWVTGADDIIYGMKLVNGRASGQSASALSKEFLTSEANFQRAGAGDNWSIEMSTTSENGPMSNIQMGGFGKARTYLLANCKG